MAQINNLPAVDQLQAGDLLAVWDTSNGDTRKSSLSLLTEYLESTLNAANATYNQGDVNAVDRTVQNRLQESVSILDFGGKPDGVTNSTQAAINAATAVGQFGTIRLPTTTDGNNYIINIASLDTTNFNIWTGDSILINGSTDPLGLPGVLINNGDEGTGRPYLRLFTYEEVVTGSDFGRSLAWIHKRNSATGSGNREAITIIHDVGSFGNTGEQLVAVKATSTTNSDGSCFGMNPTAECESSAAAGTEIVGMEVNISQKSATTIARKVGLQVVEPTASTGAGSISSGVLITQQTGAGGWREAISIGASNNTEIPIIQGGGNNGAGIRFYGGSKLVDFGIDMGALQYQETGIQFTGQVAGHEVAWKGTSATSKGFIRSDNANNLAGSLIFSDGGLILQSNNGSLANAIVLDGGADAANPITVRVNGVGKNVTQGATDSGGVGFRVLRVPN